MTVTGTREASAITSVLTTLAALPYEKDLMGIIPPAWAPRIIAIGVISTVLLRFLPRILSLFGIRLEK